MQHPNKGSGTRQDIEKASTDAGENMGSAIGNALKKGNLWLEIQIVKWQMHFLSRSHT